MTTRFAKTVAAALAATVIAISAGPAMAAGQISIGFSPTDPDQAQALGLGLQVFSLVQGLSSTGANVHQNGNGNSAGGNQHGSGNNGLIWQEGDNHDGTIHQNGNNNACGLFQFGNATKAQCLQNGNNNSGITTVFGF